MMKVELVAEISPDLTAVICYSPGDPELAISQENQIIEILPTFLLTRNLRRLRQGFLQRTASKLYHKHSSYVHLHFRVIKANIMEIQDAIQLEITESSPYYHIVTSDYTLWKPVNGYNHFAKIKKADKYLTSAIDKALREEAQGILDYCDMYCIVPRGARIIRIKNEDE
ncbi:hypothetical protein ACFL24_00545 [Patescibacteria group bacterium]